MPWRRLTHPGAVSLALRELRKRNLGKVLKFRGEVGMREISKKVETHMARLLIEPHAYHGLREKGQKNYAGWTVRAGQRLAGMTPSATSLRLAKGALARGSLHGSSLWEKRTKLGVRED